MILDVDSTLSAIEGIDWLATRRDPEVAARVASVTERAMDGEIPLDAVYGERLALVRPSAAELAALGDAYCDAMLPGADAAVARLRAAGVRVALVSGGIQQAILPLARRLRLPDDAVHAVPVTFDAAGAYAGFDATSPMARQGGKLVQARALALPRPLLAVGDGATDAEMRPALDAFAAFTGVVRRAAVVAVADVELASFDALVSLVLP